MPVNNFEKQVQQRLDELQLRPTPAVWNEVEKQIRKDKKRRRVIIFWWLLPALLTGGAITYYLANKNNSTNNETLTHHSNTAQHHTPKDSNPGISEGSAASSSLKKVQGAILPDNQATSTPRAPLINNFTDNGSLEVNTEMKRKITKPVTVQHEVVTLLPTEKENIPAQQSKALPDSLKKAGIDKNLMDVPVVPADPKEKKADSLLIVEEKKQDDKTGPPAEIAKESEAVKLKRKRWQFGITVSPGISNTWQGSLFSPEKAQLYATPNMGSGTGFSSGPFAPPVLVSSPTIGASGAIELIAQKDISKRWTIKTGLQYQYMSSHTRVGNRVQAERQVNNDISSNVIINSYYQPATSGLSDQDYSNRYHLLGGKATLSWKVVNSRNFSLAWDHSITASRLLGTSALLFDENTRSYYKDDRAFRKTQVFYSTGVSIPLMKGQTFTLSLNPVVSYGITPVLKRGTDKNSHLVNYGLGINLLFPR
jgi:hypothetical protein